MHTHHITAALVVLAALAPSAASARPIDTAAPIAARIDGAPASTPAQDLRSSDARDAADGRGTFNSPQVVVVKAPRPAQPTPADGIDWTDAGIGAGSLLGLGLIALCGVLLITHRRRAAHDAVPAGL